MKTIENIVFGGFDPDQLEFQIPSDYTCKMISHLRNKNIIVQIRLSPQEGNQIMRDRDTFFINQNGNKEKRAEIKQSINQFCRNNGLDMPTWPENY